MIYYGFQHHPRWLFGNSAIDSITCDIWKAHEKGKHIPYQLTISGFLNAIRWVISCIYTPWNISQISEPSAVLRKIETIEIGTKNFQKLHWCKLSLSECRIRSTPCTVHPSNLTWIPKIYQMLKEVSFSKALFFVCIVDFQGVDVYFALFCFLLVSL